MVLGILAVIALVWNGIRTVAEFSFNMARFVIDNMFRLVSITFSALPGSLKFVFGIALMFISLSVVMSLTFGMTNYCQPDGNLGSRNVMAGVVDTFYDVTQLIEPKDTPDAIDTYIDLPSKLFDSTVVYKGTKSLDYFLVPSGYVSTETPLVSGELRTVETTVDLFRNYLYAKSDPTKYSYVPFLGSRSPKIRDSWEDCNFLSAPKGSGRLIDQNKVNCYQKMNLCKKTEVEGLSSSIYNKDEIGQCYLTAHNWYSADPGYIGFDLYINDGNEECRPNGIECKASDDVIAPLGWVYDNVVCGLKETFGSQYEDDKIATFYYGITPESPPRLHIYMTGKEGANQEDTFSRIVDECGGTSIVVGEPGYENVHSLQFGSNPGDSIDVWDTSEVPLIDFILSRLDTSFVIPENEELYGDLAGEFKEWMGATPYIAPQIIKLPDGSVLSKAKSDSTVKDSDSTVIFTTSCLLNEDNAEYDLDVGLFGIRGVFTFQTFIYAVVVFLLMSLVGYLYK